VRAIVFGATGQIGAAVASTFVREHWQVCGASRSGAALGEGIEPLAYDPFGTGGEALDSLSGDAFDAAVWAQGANCNDSVADVDADRHLEIYKANCLYVILSMQALLRRGLLARPARLVVISSIWQLAARQTKLSYTMSKAALQGLVLSAANDLAGEGCLVNAVLPGVLETPMTRAMLAAAQIERVARSTGFNRLPDLQDVAELTHFLCSPKNTSITGQFVTVDLGYLNARVI
jgi:3-oxoacyl-[acyl-carrier protein] reductase